MMARPLIYKSSREWGRLQVKEWVACAVPGCTEMVPRFENNQRIFPQKICNDCRSKKRIAKIRHKHDLPAWVPDKNVFSYARCRTCRKIEHVYRISFSKKYNRYTCVTCRG